MFHCACFQRFDAWCSHVWAPLHIHGPAFLYAAAFGRVRVKRRIESNQRRSSELAESCRHMHVLLHGETLLARGVRSQKIRRKLVVRRAESLFGSSWPKCTVDHKSVAASRNVITSVSNPGEPHVYFYFAFGSPLRGDRLLLSFYFRLFYTGWYRNVGYE